MTPSWLELTVVGVAIAIVVVVIALCIRFFLFPGETSESHIKRRVLR